jgi:hypothetical protein
MKWPLLGVFCIFFVSLVHGQALTKEAKIARILAVTNGDATIAQVFEQLKAMAASIAPPGATPEQAAKAQALQAKIMEAVRKNLSWEKMQPQFVKLYADTYSDEEIDGMLAFYESPAGRGMVEKMPALMAKTIALTQAQMKDLLPEIQRIVQESTAK